MSYRSHISMQCMVILFTHVMTHLDTQLIDYCSDVRGPSKEANLKQPWHKITGCSDTNRFACVVVCMCCQSTQFAKRRNELL